MQSIRYGQRGPASVLAMENIPAPEPGENQVLIKVHYAGVNPVDTHLRGPHHPKLVVPLPATPGKDAAGTIAKLGPGVAEFQAGERVYISNHTFRSSGTYAEYHVANVGEVHHLPDNYSFQEGASLGSPSFTAARAIFIAARAKPGESVLVHGASGAVGTACLQMGHNFGLKTYGTAGTEEGLQRILANKAVGAFNHREKGYVSKIKDTVGVKGFDVVIEMSAHTNLQSDLEVIARKGRIVIVGGKDTISIAPALFIAKEATVTGVKLAESTSEEWKTMTNHVRRGVENGWLRPTVHKEYSLSNAAKAHQDLEENETTQGKLVLRVV